MLLRRERKGYAVTGGQDAIINVFSLSSKREDSNFQLIGHTNNVCALHALADGTIVSGSWDQYVFLVLVPLFASLRVYAELRECGRSFS